HLPAHLEYMIELEKRGVLFASGPLADGAGPPSGAGLTILRAANAGEARALAEADPFVIQGLRSYELKEWTVMEGAFGLRVNLSDQSVEVA
ncbi:MAG TPA: YciI family protein, partial [Xanthobacteraceae bacterium]|nr:YciI family protein [Xanthobacteraceae bacterium]